MNKRKPLTDEQKADAQRLKAIYEERKAQAKDRGIRLTQADVGEMCGWESGQSAVSQYINGNVALNLEALLKLSEALDFNPSEVSPTLAGALHSISRNDDLAVRTPSENDYVLIPQYSASGSCGDGCLADHVEINGGLAFKRDWIKRIGVKAENLFAIYAKGDSMEPYIFEGDVVLIDTSSVEPKDRQVYAIRRTTGEISIKRLIQQFTGGWIIRSDNQMKYADEAVSEAVLHEVPIIGRVIWRGGEVE